MSYSAHRGPAARFGDLFPLPVGRFAKPDVSDMGRSSQSRVTRNWNLGSRVDSVCSSLNELAGFSDPGSWPRAAVNLCQEEAVSRIRRVSSTVEPPARQRDKASLLEVLKAGPAYGSSAGELRS